MICQEDPSRFPWQCATERMARIHCKFLAVNITGPWWADAGRDAVGKGVPRIKITKCNVGGHMVLYLTHTQTDLTLN